MERDFEQEFRELKQSEIPDLWNRIEAGLSEKKAVTSAPQPVPQKKFAWRRWGTLAAACLCVVIILPAFSLLIRNKSFSGGDMSPSMESESAAYDTAMEYASDNAAEEIAEDAAAAEEMSEDAAAAENMSGAAEAEGMMSEQESGMTNSTTTTDAGGAESSASPGESAAGAAADAAPADTTSEESSSKKEDAQNAETGRTDVAENREEKAAWEELSDGQMLEEAVVQIQKADANGSETLYQVSVVQADADGLLEIETQIAIVCNADTTYDFPVGLRDWEKLKDREMYRVDLCYDGEERRFVVVTVGSVE